MTYTVIFEKTSTGYSAYAPDLPGCVAAASTLDETKALMAEAVEMHLEAMRQDGEPIPRAYDAGRYGRHSGLTPARAHRNLPVYGHH